MQVALEIFVLCLDLAKLKLEVFKVSCEYVLLGCKALELSFFILKTKLSVLQLGSGFKERSIRPHMGLLFELKLVDPQLSGILLNGQ